MQFIGEIRPAVKTGHLVHEPTINVSIIPDNGVTIDSVTPRSNSHTTKEVFLQLTNTEWYDFGITITGRISSITHPVVTFELHPSPHFANGLHLRFTLLASHTLPYYRFFPPGSITCTGYSLRINLDTLIRQLNHSTIREYGLSPPQPRTSTRLNHFRQTAEDVNRQIQEYLETSELFEHGQGRQASSSADGVDGQGERNKYA